MSLSEPTADAAPAEPDPEAIIALHRPTYSAKAYSEALGMAFKAIGAGGSMPEAFNNWSKAIQSAFYGDLPPEFFNARDALSPADRERTLLALTAARGEASAVAVHLYAAWMEGVRLSEPHHILWLVGTYAGIDRFVMGAKVTGEVLKILATSDNSVGMLALIQKLNAVQV